ncbi:hypothetical protein GCM10009775_04450 [Microbacterium aoyamense]|uniref:Uncharacterized protein n=1 Tax=Microbacterium aoyamense TaxID=344166 RepID=A0ABN2P8I2_9MICO|nr:hypothetical protein [Microbacterium aoyamense]
MDLEPWAERERTHWRQLHTFGGFLWPASALDLDEDFDASIIVLRAEKATEKAMSVEETLQELEWLLDGGVPAGLALEQVHGSLEALQRAAERRGRHDLSRRIARSTVSAWELRWGANERRSA